MDTSKTFALLTVVVCAFLAFFTVLFIDFLPTSLGGYAYQRFELLALSGFLVFLPVGFYVLRPYPMSIAVLAPTIILSVGFLFLSSAHGSKPYAWVEPGMYVFFFLAMVTGGAWVAAEGSAAGFIRYLLLIIVACCAMYGFATINVYLFALFDRVVNLVNFIPWGFVNIRYWSHIATWCLPLMPLAVLVGPVKDNRLWRMGVLLGAGLWWWILILTTSRGAALGIAFGALVVLLLFRRRALSWLKVFFAYILVGVVIWAVLSVFIPSLIADEVQIKSIKMDSSGRMPLFIEAWAMSLQNFPLGMGPQSWLTHDILTEAYAQSKQLGHPHNMYLMWAAEYGWFLIGLLGLVVAQVIRYFWIKRAELFAEGNNEQTLMLVGLTASVSAALFHAGVSAVFMAPGSMLIGLFVLVAFWALIIPKAVTDELPSEHRSMAFIRKGLAAIVFFALLVLWLLWMSEVRVYFDDMQQDEQTYSEEVGEGTLPRFWLHGNFPRSS